MSLIFVTFTWRSGGSREFSSVRAGTHSHGMHEKCRMFVIVRLLDFSDDSVKVRAKACGKPSGAAVDRPNCRNRLVTAAESPETLEKSIGNDPVTARSSTVVNPAGPKPKQLI